MKAPLPFKVICGDWSVSRAPRGSVALNVAVSPWVNGPAGSGAARDSASLGALAFTLSNCCPLFLWRAGEAEWRLATGSANAHVDGGANRFSCHRSILHRRMDGLSVELWGTVPRFIRRSLVGLAANPTFCIRCGGGFSSDECEAV